MADTLADKIEAQRKTNEWAKTNHAHYISTDYATLMPIIEELAARLEDANQLFQDIWDWVDIDSEAARVAREGIAVTDAVDQYQTKGRGDRED